MNLRSLFESGKVPEIDGFRAVAILAVVFTHICQTIPGLSFVHWNVEWCTPLFNGWIGVDLFFVLSGFLVGGQILNQIESGTFSIYAFYLRRAARILPAYFFLLFLFIAFRRDAITWTDIFKSFALITDYYPSHLGFVGSWSLSVEEQFYWVIPCLLLSIASWTRQNKLKVFLGIWISALILRAFTYRFYNLGPGTSWDVISEKIYYPFHLRMDALAAGIIVFLAVGEDGGAESVLPSLARALGTVCVLFVWFTGGITGGFFETTFQYSLLSVGFALLVWGVLREVGSSFLKSLFAWRGWAPIARLSYVVYLFHGVTIHYIQNRFPDPGILRWTLAPALMLIGSFLVALPIHLFLENPIHEWGRNRFRLST